MAEYREVHTYDHDSVSSTSSALVIFFVAVIALLVVGLLVWQPWQAPVRDTTVITQPAPSAPDTTIVNPPSNTTIINPPAESPKTEINIENKTEPPPTTGGGETLGTTGN